MCACQLNIAGDESTEKKRWIHQATLHLLHYSYRFRMLFGYGGCCMLWAHICELLDEIGNVKCRERTENASISQECNEWNESFLPTAGTINVYKVSNRNMFNIIRRYQWLGYQCYHFIHKQQKYIRMWKCTANELRQNILAHFIMFAGQRVRCNTTFGSKEYGKSKHKHTHTYITTKCCVGALEWDWALLLQTDYILMRQSWNVWDESFFVVCLFIECP